MKQRCVPRAYHEGKKDLNMEKEYRLSTKAILQMVMHLRKAGIYGVKSSLSDLKVGELTTLRQDAEQELLDKKLGVLDAEGAFQLDEELAALIGKCADCKKLLCVETYTDWGQARLLCHILEGNKGPVLELVSPDEYVLRPEGEPVAEIVNYLKLQDNDGTLTEAAFDSDLIIEQNAEGLAAAGCSEPTVRLILAAARDEEGYARVTYVEEHETENELTLMYGPEGNLIMTIEYHDIQEQFRVTPTALEDVKAKMREMAEIKEEEKK